MDAKRTHSNRSISHYEGLVRRTAAIVEPFVEDEFDEICQFLREKVWKGIEAFSPLRVRTTSKYSPDEQLERFVNSCVQNGKKDVLKKKRRDWLYIDDMLAKATDGDGDTVGLASSFENRYLCDADTFSALEPDTFTIPMSFTRQEGRVALMLYLDFKVDEIAGQLGTNRKGVAALIDSIRCKMADWAPRTTPQPEPLLAAAI